MKNKKILFLISLISSFIFLLGVIFTAKAADMCCLNGSNCLTIPSEISETGCGGINGSIIDCNSNSDCNTGSGGTTNTSSCTGSNCEFYNPIGVTTVSEFLNKFLASLRGIVAVVAIIFIVLGGIFYMLSAGSEKMVTRAKLCWTGAVIGLAIVLAAPSFLTEIIKILGGSSGVETAGLTGPSFYDIGVRVLDLLLSIFGIIAIISLVSGGGMYLTAYGDEKRIDTAKKIITYSIIGIVVALSALVIINQVTSLIGGGSGNSIPGTWI
jgi:hypothetical protein